MIDGKTGLSNQNQEDCFFERASEESSKMSRMLFASIVERKLFSSILRALGTGE